MAKVLSRIIGIMALLLISGIRRTWVEVLCIVSEGDVELGWWCWGGSRGEVLCRQVGLDGNVVRAED